MFCSSYSSRSFEVHKDEHANADEVSDRDLRHLNQKTQSNVFFERCPQFAGAYATEVGEVGSFSWHSRMRGQSQEDTECAEMPLPSCTIAVHKLMPTLAKVGLAILI